MQQCGFLYYCSLAGACTCKQMLMFKCRSHLPDAGHFQGDITVCSLQHLEIPLHIMHLSMSSPGVRRGGGGLGVRGCFDNLPCPSNGILTAKVRTRVGILTRLPSWIFKNLGNIHLFLQHAILYQELIFVLF